MPVAGKRKLDLASALDAMLTIAGELEPERLFPRLISVFLESAAAEHGALIVREHGGALRVRARALAVRTDLDVSLELGSEAGVCPAIIERVVSSLEAQIIDDATAHPAFGADADVVARGVRSVSCLPVLGRDGLVAALYVENNRTTHAFTPERIETLRSLAELAACALENAALHASLKGELAEHARALSARDAKLRDLEESAARTARESAIVLEILDAGVEDFKSFCESARGVLGEQLLLLGARGLSAEETRSLFRNVHTLKAHARTLGLQRLVEAAHAAEQACASDSATVGGAGPATLEGVRRLEGAFAEYQHHGEQKLGRLWAAADTRFQRALGAIEEALGRAPHRPSYPVRVMSQVRQTIHRVNAVPLDQVLRETARVFPSLARELGKSIPEMDWVDDGTLLAADWGRLMKDAFIHTFRNALDHGIETDAERAARGKRPRGKIVLRTERDASGVSIHLSDDGRGLPVAELRAKTGKHDCPDQVVADAIFDFGLSTARQLSTLSGRGIGMDAVRGFLREHGGDVRIEFTGDAERGYRPFELVFRLPSDATLRD
jgi:GAF domain-containing protein